MSELPKYIREGVHLNTVEIEMLIASICKEQPSIKHADRFIHSRLTEYEIGFRQKSLSDVERQDYVDWKDVTNYFLMHKLSFERQYFKRKLWE